MCGATLQRFFVLHFLVPFLIVFLRAVHLVYLHEVGSRNPLGLNFRRIAVPFHPYFM